MRFKEREAEGIVFLDFTGEIYGDEQQLLLKKIDQLVEQGKLDCVFNMGKAKRISSSGIGVMISARARYSAQGGTIKMCRCNPRVLSVLEVTRLNLVFDVYETEEEALRSLQESG
jgi:anti-sigma B factor antagonist